MGEIVEVNGAPDLKRLYLAAVRPKLAQRPAWPDQTLARNDISTDRDAVAAYSRICGFPIRDDLPLTYPHIVAFPLAVQLMAHPSFPLPLAGLVHIRNSITQHRPIRGDEPLSARVHLTEPRPHPKGLQFDIVATVAAGGETVWEETSTNLRPGREEDAAPIAPSLDNDVLETAIWQVPRDTGRRYAGVSGDVNPIHLHPLTARLFGFPRAIAHGMWTKARAVSALAERLPDACRIDVEFRKPLLLPASVRFGAEARDDGWVFAVRSDSGSTHLHGRISDGGAT